MPVRYLVGNFGDMSDMQHGKGDLHSLRSSFPLWTPHIPYDSLSISHKDKTSDRHS